MNCIEELDNYIPDDYITDEELELYNDYKESLDIMYEYRLTLDEELNLLKDLLLHIDQPTSYFSEKYGIDESHVEYIIEKYEHQFKRMKITEEIENEIVDLLLEGSMSQVEIIRLYSEYGIGKGDIRKYKKRHNIPFRNKIRWTIEELSYHFAKYGYTVLSDTIPDNHIIRFRCNKHGEFEDDYKNHTNYPRCPKCIEDNAIGGLSLRIINTPKYHNQTWRLYLVKLINKKNGYEFIKVGVTAQNVRARLSTPCFTGHSYVKIKEIPMSGFSAYVIEQYIINKYHSENTCEANLKGGSTECMNVDCLDAISSEIDDLISLNDDEFDIKMFEIYEYLKQVEDVNTKK